MKWPIVALAMMAVFELYVAAQGEDEFLLGAGSCKDSEDVDNPKFKNRFTSCNSIGSLTLSAGNMGSRNEFPSCTSDRTSCAIRCKPGYVNNGQVSCFRMQCVSMGGRIHWRWNLERLWPPEDQRPDCQKAPVPCTAPQKPVHGDVKCDGYNLGDKCTYTCNRGYDMEKVEKRANMIVTCVQDEGEVKWSKLTPTCVLIKCSEIIPGEHVIMDCTRNPHNMLESDCTFKCEKNYDLKYVTKSHESNSVCEEDRNKFDDRGHWSGAPGICDLIVCPEIRGVPNGEITYNKERYVDPDGRLNLHRPVETKATLRCNPGYLPNKPQYKTCKYDGDYDRTSTFEPGETTWSCVKAQCSRQTYDESVVEECMDGDEVLTGNNRPVGTKCTYTCREAEGTYMTADKIIGSGEEEEPSLVSECMLNAEWNRSPPTCQYVTCKPRQTAPENGYAPSCENTYGSECNFKCFPKFRPTHNDPLVCTDDGNHDAFGKWVPDAPPKCERFGCDIYGQISGGRIEYPDGRDIGSVAQVVCNDAHTHKSYEEIKCLAPDAKHKDPYWDRGDRSSRRYLCCVKCEPNPNIEFVILIDRTSVRNPEDWEDVKSSVKITIDELPRGGFTTELSIIFYDTTLDTANMIGPTMVDQGDWETAALMGNQMSKAEIAPGGVESNTAAAMIEAGEMFFSDAEKDRKMEPFIYALIGAKSSGNLEEAAKDLREKKVNVIVAPTNRYADPDGIYAKRSDLSDAFGEKNVVDIFSWGDLVAVSQRITAIKNAESCAPASKTGGQCVVGG